MSSPHLPIAHPHEPSNFLELSSPSGPSSPASSSSSSAPALSPTLSDFALPPADPWRTAAAEAAAGIHYTVDQYPTPGQPFAPPFRDEPLTVGPDTRVVPLEEGTSHGRHHIRVRVLETGEAGLLPAWNVEGALERLARLNMEFNEAATCPAERKLASRRMQIVHEISAPAEPSSTYSHLYASLAHRHDSCIPYSARKYHGFSTAPPSDEDDENQVDDPFGLAEETDGAFAVRRKDSARRKSVGFAEVARPTVFRYPSAALMEAYYGDAGEEQSEETEEGGSREDDEEWWWAGWEEQSGSDDDRFMDCE